MTCQLKKQEYISLGSLCKGSIVATSDLSANIEFNDSKQSMRIGMSSQIASSKVRQLALGDYSVANADGAIAIGVRKFTGSSPTQATANNAMAIGQGAQAIA